MSIMPMGATGKNPDIRQQILDRLARIKQTQEAQKPLDYREYLPSEIGVNLQDTGNYTDARVDALDTLGERYNDTARTLTQNRRAHALMVQQRQDMRRQQQNLTRAQNNQPSFTGGNASVRYNGKNYYPFGGKVVNYAKRFVGTPYVWGGNSLRNGVDCSGLVQQVYSHFGLKLPRVAAQQAMTGHHTKISHLRPGDLVAWGSPAHHISIYAGNGMIVEAPRPGKSVQVRKLGSWSEDKTAYGVQLRFGRRK